MRLVIDELDDIPAQDPENYIALISGTNEAFKNFMIVLDRDGPNRFAFGALLQFIVCALHLVARFPHLDEIQWDRSIEGSEN